MDRKLPAIVARIRYTLTRRGGSPHDADEMIQEAWARLVGYEREHVVDEPEAFLMRTAINLSIDAHRGRMGHGEQVALEGVLLGEEAPPVEAVVLARERVLRIEEGLARVPERARDMFMAHRGDGQRYREIADQYGLSISAVEKHVAKVTMQLIHWMDGW